MISYCANPLDPAGKQQIIIDHARSLGFIAVGFSRVGTPLFFDQFRKWVASERHGDMAWLNRNMALREDPTRLLSGCQTIITLAYPYSSDKPCTPDGFSAARYTEPGKSDYHKRLRKLGRVLARSIEVYCPESATRVCIDSAPILERSFAYSSGIGFIGKNNMLIIPGHGSYVFLLEILSTASLAFPENEPMNNQCGACTKCLDACPTGAIEKPFSMDASKCLSYLTIEYQGTIDAHTGRRMGKCFFGCDRCQEVCPFNQGGASKDISLPSTDEILKMKNSAFEERFGKSAFARAGLEKIKGNIEAVRLSPLLFNTKKI